VSVIAIDPPPASAPAAAPLPGFVRASRTMSQIGG
jgi:hypothetical protein